METFAHYLGKNKVKRNLQNVLLQIADCFVEVAKVLKTLEEGYTENENVFGERQLKLDVHTNKIFTEALKKNPNVCLVASEELDDAICFQTSSDCYSVAYDPLDGSSLADVNLAVGSIFGIYADSGFLGKTGRDQVAAIIAVYGPRLTFMISTGGGVAEFIYLQSKNSFILHGENFKLKQSKKMFAPGNLRACKREKWYFDLLEYWVKNDYTLRYSGGMVPDVNQILKKGGGIFTYPGSAEAPDGKLRLLYECAPVAYLIEKAGGIASDGQRPILDIVIDKLDKRTPIFLGSKEEVEFALKHRKIAKL